MGLDTVEMLMEIEDEFEISIPDADAEQLRTVGQTADYILHRLRAGWRGDVRVCPTARAFYCLRRELEYRFYIPRGAVRPHRRMGDLLPSGIERGTWNQVAERSNLQPERFTFRRLFKRGSLEANVTVRELIRDRVVSSSSFPPLAWRIWPKLVAIVAEAAQVPESNISRETRYIEDLF
jgi:hypothetical protein